MDAPRMSVLSTSKKAPADESGSGAGCRTIAAAAEAAPATAARLLRCGLGLPLSSSGEPASVLGSEPAARFPRPGTGSRPRSCLMTSQLTELGSAALLPGHPSGRILGARQAL